MDPEGFRASDPQHVTNLELIPRDFQRSMAYKVIVCPVLVPAGLIGFCHCLLVPLLPPVACDCGAQEQAGSDVYHL